MQNNKNIIWWVIGIVVLGLIWWFGFRSSDTPEIPDSGSNAAGQVVNQFPPASGPMTVEDYLTQKINEISSISGLSASLGGTFHVTNIEAANGSGTVSYEDGHNAYVADFTYEMSADGVPRITAFIPRSKG